MKKNHHLDATTMLAGLTVAQIQLRLARLDAEARTRSVLLRTVRARDRAAGRSSLAPRIREGVAHG